MRDELSAPILPQRAKLRNAIISGDENIAALASAAVVLAENYDQVIVICPARTRPTGKPPLSKVCYLKVRQAAGASEFWDEAFTRAVRKYGRIDVWLHFSTPAA